MEHQSEHNTAHLETRIKEFSTLLATLADTQDLEELIHIIHRPGWTTPAEYVLVSGMVNAMQEHAKALASLRQVLLNGSRAVGAGDQVELNPQPLPPGEKQMTKPRFTLESLDAAVNKINKTFPEQLKTDWREFVRSEFQLLPEQEKSLTHIPRHRVEEIQDYFTQVASHVEHGGKVQANVVTLPLEEQTPERVHDLLISSARTVEPFVDIVIAHCDADCRNWGWGPARQ